MSPSYSADRTLLGLAAALDAVDVAQRSGDIVPMSDEVRDELTSRWLYIVGEMATYRACTVRGRRVKALALQMINDKLQPEPTPFVLLSFSLARDLAVPL